MTPALRLPAHREPRCGHRGQEAPRGPAGGAAEPGRQRTAGGPGGRGGPGQWARLANSKCAKLAHREREAAAGGLGCSALAEDEFRFRFRSNPKGKHFIRLKAAQLQQLGF